MSATPPALTVAAALWPPGRLTRRPGRRPALLVLPGAARPRLLVPTGVPAAAAMLRRHSTSRWQTLGQESLAWGVRTGALALLPIRRVETEMADHPSAEEAASIEHLVRRAVPDAARVGVLLGPPRANAKPVLQVFDRDGLTIAFGKVGHDATSAALVTREAGVLADPALRALPEVEVPEVLGMPTWRGMPVLLMSAMSGAQSRAGRWELPVEAVRAVAESGGVEWCRAGDSAHWANLRAQAVAGDCRRTLALLDRALSVAGPARLGYGRWHGDWAPWNSARVDGRLQLWDWEQSATSVPLGLDAMHFVVQHGFRKSLQAPALMRHLLDRSAPALATWYPELPAQRATALLYLAEITLRYERQLRTGATPQLTQRLAVLDEVASLLLGATDRTREGVR